MFNKHKVGSIILSIQKMVDKLDKAAIHHGAKYSVHADAAEFHLEESAKASTVRSKIAELIAS